MNAGTGTSGTPAKGATHMKRTDEMPTTASATARSRPVGGKVERKMLRSLPARMVVSGVSATRSDAVHALNR
jgi:hypothetical protein